MDFDLTHPFKGRKRESERDRRGITPTPTPLLDVQTQKVVDDTVNMMSVDELTQSRMTKKNRFAYFY